MRTKRCKLCGAIIYETFTGNICEVCLDDRNESKEEQNNENSVDERSDSD